MAKRSRIKGMDETMRALNTEIAAIKDRTIGGLLAGGLIVQGTAQRRVPVEHGFLRASAYTRRAQGQPMAVEVGFSEAYAVFVHENMEQKLKGKPRPSGLGVYWGPQGQPKFLESAARDESDTVVKVVAQHARAKRRNR